MFLKYVFCLILASSGSALIAAPAEVAPKAAAEGLVTVNGETVSTELYTAYLKNRRQNQPAVAQDRAQQLALLNELVNFLLLEQDAVAKALDQRSQVAAELKLARSQLLANAAIRERLASQPIAESALRQAYDEKFKGKALDEYKVSHILLDSEQAAEAIVPALAGGRSFADLARQHSLDSSAQSGGELGWVSPGQLDPALSAALTEMRPGEYSKRPVKSEFGWHLLLLEQVRGTAQPSYGEMRASLLQAKQKELLTAYIKELRDKAQLELKALAPAASDAQSTRPQAATD